MGRNSLGKNLVVTSFGESHGSGIGATVDGFPANQPIDFKHISKQLERRKPGNAVVSSPRQEDDNFQILSGVFEGFSTGSPITFWIPNKNTKPEDYDAIKEVYRPGHADFTYQEKYGILDHRGGGRSSARITAGWVAAGALADQYLIGNHQIEITAWVQSLQSFNCFSDMLQVNRNMVDTNLIKCPDAQTAVQMQAAVENAKLEGDSLGGIIRCVIKNTPTGIGEPVFGKLHAELSKAMFSIPAVKGFMLGDAAEILAHSGKSYNDPFVFKNNKVSTDTNHSGGIQGGISNGAPIWFDVYFKPVSSISQEQNTVNKSGAETKLSVSGRHDPCVLPRAVPIVESMAALVLLDLILE